MKTKTMPVAVKYLTEGQRLFNAYGQHIGTVSELEEASSGHMGLGYNVYYYPPQGGERQVAWLDYETKVYVDATNIF